MNLLFVQQIIIDIIKFLLSSISTKFWRTPTREASSSHVLIGVQIRAQIKAQI